MRRALDQGYTADLDDVYETALNEQGRRKGVYNCDQEGEEHPRDTRGAGTAAATPQRLYQGNSGDIGGTVVGYCPGKDD